MDIVKKAIEFLAGKIKEDVTGDDALKFSQAALNLANSEAVAKQKSE